MLAALENIPDSGLDAKAVLAELDAKDAALRETAWWVAGRHPQWGDQLAGYFKEKLKTAEKLKPEERDELADRLAKFAKSEAIQKVVGERVRRRETARRRRSRPRDGPVRAEGAAGRVERRAAPRRSIDERGRDLADARRAAAALPPPKQTSRHVDASRCSSVAKDGSRAGRTPAAALAARHPDRRAARRQPATLLARRLHRRGRSRRRARRRGRRARAARSSPPTQLVGLAVALKTADPLDLPKLLGVFEKSKDEKVGLALVDGAPRPGRAAGRSRRDGEADPRQVPEGRAGRGREALRRTRRGPQGRDARSSRSCSRT